MPLQTVRTRVLNEDGTAKKTVKNLHGLPQMHPGTQPPPKPSPSPVISHLHGLHRTGPVPQRHPLLCWVLLARCC